MPSIPYFSFSHESIAFIWGALSVTTSAGQPHQHIILSKNHSARVLRFSCLKALASDQEDNKSLVWTIYLQPLLVGDIIIVSTCTFWNKHGVWVKFGGVRINLNCRSWHAWQDRMYHCMSFCRSGHQNLFSSNSCVANCPLCPKVSWAEWSIRILSFLSTTSCGWEGSEVFLWYNHPLSSTKNLLAFFRKDSFSFRE